MTNASFTKVHLWPSEVRWKYCVGILYKKFNSIKYLALSSFWNQGKWLCVKCLQVTRQILLPSHLADAVKRDRGGKPWIGSDCRLHFLMLQPTLRIAFLCRPDLSFENNENPRSVSTVQQRKI